MKSLFWELNGRIGLQLVGFIVSIILARILAPKDFGLLAIIVVIINFSSVFLDAGFSTALIQRKDVNPTHYGSVFYLNVAMGFLMALIVFLAAPMVTSIYGNKILKNLIRFMALGFIINSFGNVTRAHLRREMNFKLISLCNVFAAGFSGIIAVSLALTGCGVWSLAVQHVTHQLLANIGIYVSSRFRFHPRLRLQSIRELWPFSSRIFFSGLIDTLFINADSLIIGKVLSPAMLGYYYRAKSLENFSMRYTASSIASVLLPGLSSLQGDPDRMRQAVLKTFHLLSFISFFGCGLLWVSGREIILLLFSDKWESSIILFQIIIAGAFASQVFSLFYNVLLSTGNAKTYLTINTAHKLLLFANFASILLWGIHVYLVIFTAIRIVIYFLGIQLVSKLCRFETTLYSQTARYLLLYALSIGWTFWVRHLFPMSNLITHGIITIVVFCFVFIIQSFFITNEGLKILVLELKSVFSKTVHSSKVL